MLGPSGRRVVSGMARKGVLDRVRRGVYVTRPIHAFARPWSLSAVASVEQALADEPHYLGGLVAFSLHRLTEQTYSSAIDVYVVGRRRPAVISNARVRFHQVPESAMGVGIAKLSVEQVAVRMSDPERTLLDALDRPAAMGGLTQAVRMFAGGLEGVDVPRLIVYALELSPPSTLQRVGVLLERRGVPEQYLRTLADRVRGTSNKPAMVPGPRRGHLHARWRIIENDVEQMEST